MVSPDNTPAAGLCRRPLAQVKSGCSRTARGESHTSLIDWSLTAVIVSRTGWPWRHSHLKPSCRYVRSRPDVICTAPVVHDSSRLSESRYLLLVLWSEPRSGRVLDGIRRASSIRRRYHGACSQVTWSGGLSGHTRRITSRVLPVYGVRWEVMVWRPIAAGRFVLVNTEQWTLWGLEMGVWDWACVVQSSPPARIEVFVWSRHCTGGCLACWPSSGALQWPAAVCLPSICGVGRPVRTRAAAAGSCRLEQTGRDGTGLTAARTDPEQNLIGGRVATLAATETRRERGRNETGTDGAPIA